MKLIALAACAIVAGLAQPASSQNVQQDSSSGIPGRLDQKTGTFRPISQNPIDSLDAAPAVAPTAGRFVINMTIHIASANLPAGAPLLCTLSASSFDIVSGQSNEETATVLATRSGATGTCTVAIPYSWVLNTPGQDQVNLSYSVSTATATGVGRFGTHSLPAFKVPANGVVTTQAVNTTI